MMKYLLTILGLLSLGRGILGAFLFLRGNRNLYDWLMNHPRLGTYISNFVKHKAIPPILHPPCHRSHNPHPFL